MQGICYEKERQVVLFGSEVLLRVRLAMTVGLHL